MSHFAFHAQLAALALLSTTSSSSLADTRVTHMPAHTSERFDFTANASYAQVFPLFGALEEKVWAPGWNPQFVWPLPAADCAGMVFRTSLEGRIASWVNTAFDPSTGRVQYVYVVPDVMTTLITLSVRDQGSTTSVKAQYERTSLSPHADELVSSMASGDRGAGPEWAAQINSYLARKEKSIP